MLQVMLGSLAVLALIFVVMALWGRIVANRLEESPLQPGNDVSPKAKKS
jgi:hypothetical protein